MVKISRVDEWSGFQMVDHFRSYFWFYLLKTGHLNQVFKRWMPSEFGTWKSQDFVCFLEFECPEFRSLLYSLVNFNILFHLFRLEAKKKKQAKKDSNQLMMTLERSWPEPKPDPDLKIPSSKKCPVIPKPPPLPDNLHVVSPLDIRLDTVTR